MGRLCSMSAGMSEGRVGLGGANTPAGCPQAWFSEGRCPEKYKLPGRSPGSRLAGPRRLAWHGAVQGGCATWSWRFSTTVWHSRSVTWRACSLLESEVYDFGEPDSLLYCIFPGWWNLDAFLCMQLPQTCEVGSHHGHLPLVPAHVAPPSQVHRYLGTP